MAAHVVLVGDSILDNGAYVHRGGDVASVLRDLLPGGSVTLLARDGAVIAGAREQLRGVPSDATLLVISAGGNDALRAASLLLEPARSVAEALEKVLAVRKRFAEDYRMLLDGAQSFDPPTAICTIYDVLLPDLQQRRLANLALGVLNDVITREAARRRLPLIDLRVMFESEALFANAIEPSELGSQAIASAIEAVLGHQHAGPSMIYAGSP
ncbi:MAG TPA: SGNH/GDSL hydrolase family protein [Devosia sp.]|jgi:lysophospholipase L1-like esterase|uniref:SGNH/GDSL hydrolase family protein n=1 Tax=Devosia sp. TaxID=1871048 RepID=UPI002F944E70